MSFSTILNSSTGTANNFFEDTIKNILVAQSSLEYIIDTILFIAIFALSVYLY